MAGAFYFILKKYNLGRLFLRPDVVFLFIAVGAFVVRNYSAFPSSCNELILCFDG